VDNIFYCLNLLIVLFTVVKEPYPARSTYQVAKLPLVGHFSILFYFHNFSILIIFSLTIFFAGRACGNRSHRYRRGMI